MVCVCVFTHSLHEQLFGPKQQINSIKIEKDSKQSVYSFYFLGFCYNEK